MALAGGGYGTALIVYVLNRRNTILLLVPLSSLLAGLCGSGHDLLMDIGQWFNFWRPFTSWVILQYFWYFIYLTCYTLVQILESGDSDRKSGKISWLFKGLASALNYRYYLSHFTSSLNIFVMVDKLYPLWWSPLLPCFPSFLVLWARP